jgi:hypothetical protein
MDCTSYLFAIIEAHPTTAHILLQPSAVCDIDALPDGVTVESWGEAYSEARDDDEHVLVRFNV